MKKLIIFIIIITILTITACQSNEVPTITSTPEIEATTAPTSEPTATPEPTLSLENPEVKYPTLESIDEIYIPDNYDFVKEESKLIIHHQFGDVVYEGVTKAGGNESGFRMFYFEASKQEAWITNGLEIEILDHSIEACLPSQSMAALPSLTSHHTSNSL